MTNAEQLAEVDALLRAAVTDRINLEQALGAAVARCEALNEYRYGLTHPERAQKLPSTCG